MSKNHRGTGVRTLPARRRGTCPICKKEHIKVLYEQTIDGQQVKICKYCNAALKNKAKAAAPVVQAAAEAPAEESAPAAE